MYPSKMMKGLFPIVAISIAGMMIARANAQTPGPTTGVGWSANVQSTSGSVTPSASYAIVDATQYTALGTDLCAMIASVFQVYNSSTAQGIIVDARGVPSSALTCSNINPWGTFLTSISSGFSNTVLLPAGTIIIEKSWILPNYTHVIGLGPNTTVVTAAGGPTSDLIEMGQPGNPCVIKPGVYDCPGIVIEHLGIVGNGHEKGISNCCSQELSRVNDVSISNVTTGLALTDTFAQNSGPYSNLTISAVNKCLSIGPASTGNVMINSRGVHGMTCTVSSATYPAITIDGPSNSLEDISISGASSTTQDGILIGSQASAQGNLLFNIRGSGLRNIIHISGNNQTGQTGTGNCPFPETGVGSGTVYNVCDVTILGVSTSVSNGITIQDDLTNSSIADPQVAMYIVGEIIGTNSTNIGYSRYTTASAPTTTNGTPWLVGTVAPSASCSSQIGTLYSCIGTSTQCTSGGYTAALWECVGSTGWKHIQ